MTDRKNREMSDDPTPEEAVKDALYCVERNQPVGFVTATVLLKYIDVLEDKVKRAALWGDGRGEDDSIDRLRRLRAENLNIPRD
jgi:hypothetical protein